MASLKQIEDFIAATPIALAGVSRDPKKFGYTAFKELKEKGLDLIPVNPNASDILGVKAYKDLTSISAEVKGVIIMTKKDKTASLVREAKAKGIKNIWIQQMADTKEAVKELEGTDINYITGECILMHYKPHSVHKFHKGLRKFFGVFPK
jgi:predicted CoA-binding protein